MNIATKKNLKISIVTALLTFLLTASIIYYVYAIAPSTTFTISGGPYPSAPTYTIWIEGSNYFAKDVYGNIDFSGTNATTVIQSALDASGRSDIIYLRGRVFDLGSSFLQLKHDGLRLIGESGWLLPQTELKVTAADYAIKVRKPDGSALYGYEIANMYIDGATTGYGIELYNAHWGSVHDIYFVNTVISLKIHGSWESEIYSNQIRSPTNRAIWIDGQNAPTVCGSHHVNIRNNYIDGTPYGIIIDDDANNPMNIVIEGNNFGLITGMDAIFVNYMTRNLKIQDNYIEGAPGITGSNGIVLNGQASKPMTNTQILRNNFVTPNRAIYIDYANGTTIDSNFMYAYGTSSTFIWMTGNAENVKGQYNKLDGATQLPNYTLTSEAYVIIDSESGMGSSVSNGDWQVHNLDAVPDVIILTSDANTNVYANAKNSTHFQYGIGSGTPDVYWYIEDTA